MDGLHRRQQFVIAQVGEFGPEVEVAAAAPGCNVALGWRIHDSARRGAALVQAAAGIAQDFACSAGPAA